MPWIGGLVIGVGLGLVCFGGLRLTVSQLLRRPRLAGLLAVASVGRLLAIAAAMAILSQQQPGATVPALAGLLLARWLVVSHVRGGRRAE